MNSVDNSENLWVPPKFSRRKIEKYNNKKYKDMFGRKYNYKYKRWVPVCYGCASNTSKKICKNEAIWWWLFNKHAFCNEHVTKEQKKHFKYLWQCIRYREMFDDLFSKIKESSWDI